MNIESLKYFYLIAKKGSISNVAKEFHISQSALSQQIKKLENELNNKLMERSNKGVKLTEVGKIVYKYADKMLKTYENMVNNIEQYEQENISIKIKACHAIADYALPCTLVLSNKIYPLHKYKLSSGACAEIIRDVSNNKYDIGFTYNTHDEQMDDDNIVCSNIGTRKMVFVSKYSEQTPDELTVEQLLSSCMITYTGENDISEALHKNFEALGYTMNNLNCNLEVRTIESAKTLVSKGHGVAFLPYISVKEELYKNEYKLIDVPGFNMDIDIMMLFNKDHSPYVQEFITWFNTQGKTSFC
jgi:LysR family transcriptional regulator, transcriptional activator of the cysJI operon